MKMDMSAVLGVPPQVRAADEHKLRKVAHLEQREDRHAVVRVMEVDGLALLQLKLVFSARCIHET